jgi:DNA-binding transcriptional ArsR family regulator
MTAMNKPMLGDQIKNLKITEQGKNTIKKIDFVYDQKRIEILHNPVRLLILQILRDGVDDTLTEESYDHETKILHTKRKSVKRQAMSVLEIIRASKNSKTHNKLTKNQMYHHLPLLEEGGFVVKCGVVTTGKRTTDYYRRTAENFVTYGLHHDPEKYGRSIEDEIAKTLPAFNFNLAENKKNELSKLLVETEVMRLKWAPVVESLIVEDIAQNRLIDMFDKLLWIYSTGEEDFMNNMEKIRSLIFRKF